MTLAEVLVAMAIFAIIFVAALMIYDRSNKVFKTGVESAELQQNTRVAFDKMLSEIRMAGYDYDRDGFPTAAGESQQPDEQIEFAAPGAITFRANLDFDEPGTDRGRETALEAGSQFPVVTTGNDEIITYALESQTGTNPDTITFFADVTDGTTAKRQAYPGTGGAKEDKIEIKNVDLCVGGCNNPPYTLLRITLDGKGQPVRTPLANNIRSMQFNYFNDASGAAPLTITDPGGGQYDPANPGASAIPRAERARIRGIGVTVVGMSEAPDFSYTDPTEPLNTTAANFTSFRKYRLETLVVARNLGKRGLREQQTAPPGPPTLDSAYFGICGGVTLNWTAPPNNPGFGSVESYVVLYDTDILSTDPPANPYVIGLATSYTIPGIDNPDTEYRFTVAATNSWGTTYSGQFITGKPLNATKPDSPTGLVASGDGGAGGAALPNRIELGWVNPTTNASGSLSCKLPGGGGCAAPTTNEPHPSETRGVVIYRDTDPNFTAGPGNKIFETLGHANSWVDTTAANCTTYYYRIQLVETCSAAGNMNVSGNTSQAISDVFPAPGDQGIMGRAESYVAPEAPTNLTVLNTSSCSDVGGGVILCNVDLQWPEVKVDVNGDQIAVNEYRVEVSQNTATYTGSPYPATEGTGLDTENGVASFQVQGLPQVDADGNPYEYEFTVIALNCAVEGDPSPAAKYPLCDFGTGAKVVIQVGEALAGNGTSGAPFEVEGDASIALGTDDPTVVLKSLSANAYDVATGALVAPLVPSPGPAAVLTTSFPDTGEDLALYRIDYVLTDSADCQTSGSIFIRNIQISCPFIVPVVPTLADPDVTIQLKNNTPLEIRILKVEFDWNEPLAGSDKDVDFEAVRFPTAPAGAIGCGTYDCVPQSSFTGNAETTSTIVATAPGGILTLPPNDTTGNYRIRFDFSPQGNGKVNANPVTRAAIEYKLPTDTAVDPNRTCTVFP